MSRPVALVTGASAGIGRAFATTLARNGHDLVVVARDTARLDALAKELEAAHGTTTEVLTADLSHGADVATVEARLADSARPIDLLVNNAGFGTMGRFHELPIRGEISEIGLNVVAVTRLTHAALPGMVERGCGGVINVSSIAGVQPTPLNATYGATKAFVTSLSEAIHEELKGTGVNCMVLCPGLHPHRVPGAGRHRFERHARFSLAVGRDRRRLRAQGVRQGQGRLRAGTAEPSDRRLLRRRAVRGRAPHRRHRGQARREVAATHTGSMRSRPSRCDST